MSWMPTSISVSGSAVAWLDAVPGGLDPRLHLGDRRVLRDGARVTAAASRVFQSGSSARAATPTKVMATIKEKRNASHGKAPSLGPGPSRSVTTPSRGEERLETRGRERGEGAGSGRPHSGQDPASVGTGRGTAARSEEAAAARRAPGSGSPRSDRGRSGARSRLSGAIAAAVRRGRQGRGASVLGQQSAHAAATGPAMRRGPGRRPAGEGGSSWSQTWILRAAPSQNQEPAHLFPRAACGTRPQVAQGLRRPAQLFGQRRGVEVGVGVVRIDANGLLVGEQRLGRPPQVLEGDAEVERRRPVVGSRGERRRVVRLGRRGVAGLVEQPAEVDVRVRMRGVEREGAPVGRPSPPRASRARARSPTRTSRRPRTRRPPPAPRETRAARSARPSSPDPPRRSRRGSGPTRAASGARRRRRRSRLPSTAMRTRRRAIGLPEAARAAGGAPCGLAAARRARPSEAARRAQEDEVLEGEA